MRWMSRVNQPTILKHRNHIPRHARHDVLRSTAQERRPELVELVLPVVQVVRVEILPRLRPLVRDLVRAEVALSDQLGIPRYLLAVGPSLGGMRSLEWAIEYPDRIGAICTIGSSAVATGDQIGTWSTEIHAIKADPHFHGGDFYEQKQGPNEGMGIARKIAHLSYRTEYEMDTRFGRDLQGDDTGRYAVTSYLDHQAHKLQKR